MLLWTECNLKCNVCLKPTRPLDCMTSRKQKMIVFREIVYRTSVEFGIRRPSFLARCLVKYLSAQSKSGGDLPLHLPADESPVMIIFAWVKPIASASVGCPSLKTLLQPDRKKYLGVPTAQSSLA